MTPRRTRVPGRAARFHGWAALVACLARPSAGTGQEPAEAILEGRALLADRPLADVQVVLHRVAPDDAGELDSISSGPDGTFRFLLPHVPDPEARSEVYFASVRHLGILYFGPPVTDPVQLDTVYVIQAYDTVSAPGGGAELPVLVRNVFLEQDGDGWSATDLFQISNEGDRTLVAGTGDVTWAYPLPLGASDFQVGQGDLSADQIAFDGDRVRVSSPLPPGERLIVLRYRLDELSTTIPLPGRTDRAELLIREPAPPLRVTQLSPLATVELEPGSSYRRYLAEGLSGVTVTVALQDPSTGYPVEWLAVVLALVLVAVAIAALKRPSASDGVPGEVPGPSPPPGSTDERRLVLLEIARLDEAHARDGDLEDYRERRRALLARLSGLDP